MRARALLGAMVFVGGVGLMGFGSGSAMQPEPKGKQPEAKTDKPDPKAFDRAELDKRLRKGVFDASDYGTKLYNAGRVEDCYRVYQGALIALLPLLDHRPKLQAYVKDQLEKAAAMKPDDGAFTLRKALDAIFEETSTSVTPQKRPLWDRLGGEKGVKAIVHDFVANLLADKTLDLTRGGKYKLDAKAVEQLEEVLVDIVRDQTGGPIKPTLPNLRAYLPGTKITNDEFDTMLRHLQFALTKNKVADTEAKEVIYLVRSFQKVVVNQ